LRGGISFEIRVHGLPCSKKTRQGVLLPFTLHKKASVTYSQSLRSPHELASNSWLHSGCSPLIKHTKLLPSYSHRPLPSHPVWSKKSRHCLSRHRLESWSNAHFSSLKHSLLLRSAQVARRRRNCVCRTQTSYEEISPLAWSGGSHDTCTPRSNGSKVGDACPSGAAREMRAEKLNSR